jgi:multicomponent Na+:H+ antiporter subunit E
MMSNILQTGLWFFVWMLLSWPPSIQDVLIGIPVALFVFMMTQDLLVKKPSIFRNPMRYLWFVYYVIVFLWGCLRANIDVAFRVLHPDLPIRPGTIRVKTHLKSDAGLTFLANSITLTPGTTSVDIDRDNGILYVHCLYISDKYDTSSMKLGVVDNFEKILGRIFE